ncbi:hypothetical protein FOCC_FOCC000600 [Frankliniella occidentalis]|nr:hypothetical protein FOCC_FOCC000600 [Frankliniella occidentalis]
MVCFSVTVPVRVVWAAHGMDADLPCNVSAPIRDDRPNMVLWFKDSEGVPLYTFDNRNGDLDRAEHGAIARPKAGKGRYFFLTSANGVPLPPSGPRASPHNWEADDELVPREMARLRILNVSDEDAGVFRCRVDFLNSPTTNFRVNLTLATPPSAPVVTDATGVEIGPTVVAGPFQEGSEMQLSCSVSGGK